MRVRLGIVCGVWGLAIALAAGVVRGQDALAPYLEEDYEPFGAYDLVWLAQHAELSDDKRQAARDILEGARIELTVAQRAQGTRGVAGDHLVLVAKRPPQRRLDRLRLRREVDQDVDGTAPDGDRVVAQRLDQQRNRGRTDPPQDVERHRVELLVLGRQESPEQGQ